MEKSINPEKDIINFVDFLFNCIKDNGTIFIVYTDLENSYSGDVTLDYYKNKYDENTKHCFSNIKKIYRARNYMFKENNIEKILRNKYNNFNIKIYETESYFYGNNLEDLAAMGLVGELLPSNNDIFDINKLKYILNLLYNNKININIEDRNILQKNMFKVNQNQVVYIIKKEQEQYNNISEEYKISKKLPFREYIEKNSLFELIGNINGFNVLDLACGEGHYSRILEKIGAKEVIGIDISENMINIAKKENQINNIKNVKYYNCNVTEMELLDIEVEYFDIVIAAYLLNYASSKEELFNFTKNIFKYLKPGCKFVTINDNPSIYCFDNCSLKYNYIKKLKNNNIPKNGDSIDWILFNSDSVNDKLCEFTTYHWDKDIYIEAFKHAGFNEIEFIPCTISEKGIKKYNDTYWNNFLNHPHFICIKAIKPF
jgi:2-polyprenyl-3-methyl-5-hydroxy-6-metoxy-1,4-benzoquinol methylase